MNGPGLKKLPDIFITWDGQAKMFPRRQTEPPTLTEINATRNASGVIFSGMNRSGVIIAWQVENRVSHLHAMRPLLCHRLSLAKLKQY
jgi:hypothetical protein